MAVRAGAAARTSDRGNGAVCNSSTRERWMRSGRRGAERSRAAERRRRAARRSVHLKARNALVARVGLLGLLAQDHGLVAAVERTRRRLEAALREGEPRRSSQDRRDQAHCGDARLHSHTFPPPLTPQRTMLLIAPDGNRFFGRIA